MAAYSQRRFLHKPRLTSWSDLPDGHEALRKGRTRYPAMVVFPGLVKNILKSGDNSIKIGKVITKGRWKGMPIFTLTLEERATCPSSCELWTSCYGNKMHWGERLMPGKALVWRLGAQLKTLNRTYPAGFVVRLHILGDFYSLAYVKRWLSWLRRFPALRVYGYTARTFKEPIGALLERAADRMWDRFAIRISAPRFLTGAEVIDGSDKERLESAQRIGTVCPVDTGKTECCATCGYCWQTRRNVIFIKH